MPTSTTPAYTERSPLAGDGERAPSSTAPRDSSTAAVELTGVAQRLGGRWALRGVTLHVARGEVVAVVGPNGSGKTTLLRVVATALTPTRGSGRVFGSDLVGDADAVREVVGILGHATGLYDDLTASENLAFAMRMYGRDPSAAAIAAALEVVGMGSHAAERTRTLSTGMRRRVALARLLLRRPRLLLLDEPYNTFDPTGVALVDAFIRDTAREGGAVLVVTHDLARSTRAGYDRVIALRDGQVESDTVAAREASA